MLDEASATGYETLIITSKGRMGDDIRPAVSVLAFR